MIVHIARGVAMAALLSLLVACHADDPAAAGALDLAAPERQAAPLLVAPAAPAPVAATPVIANPAPLVTESERRAEELRLVDYEQAYSIEMNRLAQEQAERARRGAVALQAGIVQGPGCEGTEGYAAQQCERSLQ